MSRDCKVECCWQDEIFIAEGALPPSGAGGHVSRKRFYEARYDTSRTLCVSLTLENLENAHTCGTEAEKKIFSERV
jgi:hypothetical protein